MNSITIESEQYHIFHEYDHTVHRIVSQGTVNMITIKVNNIIF